jgi:hypothetical protein
MFIADSIDAEVADDKGTDYVAIGALYTLVEASS